MRALSLVVMFVAFCGAAFVAISHDNEPDSIYMMKAASRCHALAVVISSSLIAMAIAFRTKSKRDSGAGAIAVVSFQAAAILLALSLEKLHWREGLLLTFAIIFSGGLIAMAISSHHQLEKRRSPGNDEPQYDEAEMRLGIHHVGDGSITDKRPDGLLGPDQADADLTDDKAQ